MKSNAEDLEDLRTNWEGFERTFKNMMGGKDFSDFCRAKCFGFYWYSIGQKCACKCIFYIICYTCFIVIAGMYTLERIVHPTWVLKSHFQSRVNSRLRSFETWQPRLGSVLCGHWRPRHPLLESAWSGQVVNGIRSIVDLNNLLLSFSSGDNGHGLRQYLEEG